MPSGTQQEPGQDLESTATMAIPDEVIEAIGGVVGSSVSLAATYPLVQVSIWQALEHKSDSKQQQELKLLEERYKHLPTPVRQIATVCLRKPGDETLRPGRNCTQSTTCGNLSESYAPPTVRQAWWMAQPLCWTEAMPGSHSHLVRHLLLPVLHDSPGCRGKFMRSILHPPMRAHAPLWP